MSAQHARTAPLDGIRALAVWAVMLYHAGAPLFKGGWLGVDIFFVLSGFLITTLLLKEYSKTQTVNLPNFWFRRILRLVPAYAVYMAIMTLCVLVTAGTSWNELSTWTPAKTLIAYWTYWGNYLPRGGFWEYEFLLVHLWSLAVEQQFYLLFPPILVAGLVIRRPVILLIGVLVFCVVLTVLDILPGAKRLVLETRGLSILLGCLMATMAATNVFAKVHAETLRRCHQGAILVSLALAAVVFALSQIGWSITQTVLSVMPALWITTSIVIVGYWYNWSSFLSKLLSLRFLVWSGQISYGLYLYHMLAWGLIFHGDPWDFGLGREGDYAIKLVLYFSLTYLAAWISWRWIEAPAMRLRRRKTAQVPAT